MKAIPLSTMILIITGCSAGEPPNRAAEEAMRRQAAQNQEIARQTRDIAAGSRELVQADAQARRELAELHGTLVTEQREIGRQRDVLERERRQFAATRHRAPLVAAAIQQTGLIVACLLPLLLAAVTLWQLHRSGDENVLLNEMLIQELTSPRSRLLPAADPPALESPQDSEAVELPF